MAAAGETVRPADAAEAAWIARVIRSAFGEYRGVLQPPRARSPSTRRRCAGEAGRDRVRLGVRLNLPRTPEFFERLGYRQVGLDSHTGSTVPTFAWFEKPVGSRL